MFSPKKILLWIFSMIIWAFLIYTSYIFIQNTTVFEKPKFKDIKNNSEYIIENRVWKIKEVEKKASKNDLVITYLNNIDKIISYWNKIESIKNKSKNIEKINLKKGNFLVNIQNITNKYSVKWYWFNIKNNWPSSFYIDSSLENPKKEVYIFSLDSILEIDLVIVENQKVANTIYLYPHQYIKFNPILNKVLKDSDVLRVNQVFDIRVLNEKILLKDGKFNDDFLKKIVIWDNYKKEKIKTMFLYTSKDKNQKLKELNDFMKKKVYSISWESLLESVTFWVDLSVFLFNVKKKKIYYKNKILKTIINILNFDLTIEAPQNIVDKENLEKNLWKKLNKKILKLKELYNSLEKNLVLLKKYSEDDYNYFKKFSIYYFELFIKWDFPINKKIEIAKFRDKLNWKNTNFKDNYLIELYNFYQKYNYWEKNDLYFNIWNFLINYIKDGIPKKEKWYFVDYLWKFILESFKELNNWKNINFKYLINIINTYTNISLDYYEAKDIKDKTKRETLIKTWITNYINLLKELTLRIRRNFFKFKLSNTNVLIKKENNFKITEREIDRLRKNTDILNWFIDKNKNILEDNVLNKIKLKKNENIKEKLKIYFEAIKDYETYISKTEEKNHKFLSNNINLEKITKLDKESILEYLSRFNHINLDNVEINIKGKKYCSNLGKENKIENDLEEYCYEVKNLLVWGEKKISFLLFPYEENTIKNIVIDWENKKDINQGSYPLNIIESNFSSYSQNLTESYEFEDFFYFIFIANIVYKTKEDFVFEKQGKEKAIIRSIKNSLLLGKWWSLDAIKNYLKIRYENIILIEQWKNDYKIEIQNAELKYKWVVWNFSSEYLYKNGEVSSFKNPKVSFKSPFSWVIINFLWVFNLDNKKNSSNFENILEKLVKEKNNVKLIDKLTELIWYLRSITSENAEINIDYNYRTNIFIIKLDDYKLEIYTKWDNLTKVLHNWKNILTKMDKMDNLSKYFNN